MKRFIKDICDELGIAVERALCDWSSYAKIRYQVPSGVVVVSIDSNDDLEVSVIHNNGKVRTHENIKQAIYDGTGQWCDYKEVFW